MRKGRLAISFSALTFLLATTATAQQSGVPLRGLPTPQQAPQERGPQGQPIDPAGVKGISPFMIKVLEGNAAYAARDFAGAIAAYREAIQLNPEHPLGHYMLGQAHLAANQASDAEAAFQRGLRFVGNNKELQAKLLFVLADLHERQRRLGEAKNGYAAYVSFCKANPQAPCYPESAEGRIAAIDRREEIAQKAALVKQRAEEREKELGLPTPAQAAN